MRGPVSCCGKRANNEIGFQTTTGPYTRCLICGYHVFQAYVPRLPGRADRVSPGPVEGRDFQRGRYGLA